MPDPQDILRGFKLYPIIGALRVFYTKTGMLESGLQSLHFYEAEAETSRPRQGSLVPRQGRDQGKTSQGA